jgi:hypothetical protein
MGWWQIDPLTGEPAREQHSKLSRPPDFVLLNAVPGVDDAEEAHYMGDGPWDMVYLGVNRIKELLGVDQQLTADEARALVLNRTIPASLAGLTPESATHLLLLIDEMWKNVDWCYQDDWGRPARTAEKRWVGEYAVNSLAAAEPGAAAGLCD